MQENEVTERIIGVAISVHRALGPGLLESAYKACMVHDLRLQGLQVDREIALPVVYRGLELDCAYRVDLIVANQIVVEAKCVDTFDPIHYSQLLTYLRLLNLRVGLLINFKVPLLKNGIKRLVNGYNSVSSVPL